MKLPLLNIKFLSVLFFLAFATNCFSQSTLNMLDKKGKTKMQLKENKRCKIKFYRNNEIVKVKGNLHLLNDSQIMVDSNVINIHSIYKMGKLPYYKQYLGHSAGLWGLGTTGLGAYFMYTSFETAKSTEQGAVFKAYLYALAGSSLLTIGPPLAYVGEYFAHGSMTKVNKRNRKLEISL